jgi:hypothetical protein
VSQSGQWPCLIATCPLGLPDAVKRQPIGWRGGSNGQVHAGVGAREW